MRSILACLIVLAITVGITWLLRSDRIAEPAAVDGESEKPIPSAPILPPPFSSRSARQVAAGPTQPPADSDHENERERLTGRVSLLTGQPGSFLELEFHEGTGVPNHRRRVLGATQCDSTGNFSTTLWHLPRPESKLTVRQVTYPNLPRAALPSSLPANGLGELNVVFPFGRQDAFVTTRAGVAVSHAVIEATVTSVQDEPEHRSIIANEQGVGSLFFDASGKASFRANDPVTGATAGPLEIRLNPKTAKPPLQLELTPPAGPDATISVNVVSEDVFRIPVAFCVEIDSPQSERISIRRVHSGGTARESASFRAPAGHVRIRLAERLMPPCAPYDARSVPPRHLTIRKGESQSVTFVVPVEPYIKLSIEGRLCEPLAVILHPLEETAGGSSVIARTIRYLHGGGYETSRVIKQPGVFWIQGAVRQSRAVELVGVQSNMSRWSKDLPDLDPTRSSLHVTAEL